ncbi:hypothetical protein E2562_007170 [Oryza meyeriana var. granulata]|uniref:Uncharacterized protein n=1 Tax=Oryza meyeriana var. granulata TaxID=110450 RepID=A0A6G1CDQ3_9ORYZ|nr:hypothetical protein E2562_007170 [Oryza meyeriana var. granulata]
MEDAKESAAADQSPTPNPPAAAGPDEATAAAAGRRPFTSLTQEEADLALARVLQEQERAYMMLSVQHGGEYAASDAGSYELDEEGEGLEGEEGSNYEEETLDEDEEVGDADADAAELDPAQYGDDEAFARALQDSEEREVAGRLMALAGLSDWRVMDHDDDDDDDDEEDDDDDEDEDGDDPQDAWEDVDPDEYSYEK